MKFVSLFAGIGGLDLGFERAGMTCVGQVEIDPKARSVLTRHWPAIPKHDDVLTAKEWADAIGITGSVDLVCGGFPCQPFSVAGKRLGRDDLRGNLFWNALEFTVHVGAPTIVIENVPGILTSDQGRTWGQIITDLAEGGFPYVEWVTLDAQEFGVPQRRRRVFAVASARDPRRVPVFLEPESLRGDLAEGDEEGQVPSSTAGSGPASGPDGLTDSLSLSLGAYWDGGQVSDCLDVSMLVKGQMLPEKRRMPCVIVPSPSDRSSEPSTPGDTPAPTTVKTPTTGCSSSRSRGD